MLPSTSAESARDPEPSPGVLVAEDDPNLGDVVARYLAREGMAVEVVSNGLDALERDLALNQTAR